MARGKAPVLGPFALGHEAVAEVIETSDDVHSVAPGDRVIVPFQINCGTCAMCRRGRTSSCASVPKMAAYGLGPLGGSGDYGGAVCDVLRIPFADAMLVKVDRAIDLAVLAAFGDNAIDGWRTVAGPLSREPGANVLVASGGAPSIGLYAVAAARALGAGEVVYVDPAEERCAIAAALGARVVCAKTEPLARARDQTRPTTLSVAAVRGASRTRPTCDVDFSRRAWSGRVSRPRSFDRYESFRGALRPGAPRPRPQRFDS